ncbi:MAG: tetratricopeptide repeat protein [Pseudomonadota bacterium]|nr:tetratricopeptide repeat protein [Pseudomonadota bacterium]
MALTPKNNQDPNNPPKLSAEDEVAMREIDEAVRQDDALDFIKKYGVAIGSVLGVILLGLAGYLFWDSRTESALEADSEKLVSVLDYAQEQEWPTVDQRAGELADLENAGVRTSARFLQAGAALEQGEVTRAVELYASIAADEGAPPELRDFARVREVASNFDDREPADIIAKLKDIAVAGNPFFGSAAELTAIAHLEAGNREEAGALFSQIAKDEELPESLRSRSRQMAGLLGVDAIEDVEKLLEDEGIDPDALPGVAAPPAGPGPGAASGQ